ncbi:MAG: universal stress protein [Chloroflexi bacterium]|nr:universal stress protein [Chloroflexota bacterium]
METILVPLDGSPLSERALPYAELLARESGGRLLLLRAAPNGLLAEPDAGTAHYHTVAEAEEYLTAVRTRMLERAAPGKAPEVEVAAVRGEAAGAILSTARDRNADLIAMATHGRSGLGRWLYGSVADHVMRHAETPVLLIPAACEFAWGRVPPATTGSAVETSEHRRRILVPLDGSELAQEVLPAASDLAKVLHAELLLLQVIEPPTYGYADGYAMVEYDPAVFLVQAREYLEGVANTLRASGHAVSVFAEVGMAASTIATVAREQRVDAIAMATHGRGGLVRLVLGSVATGVLHLARAPLLLRRPAALRPVRESTETIGAPLTA